MNSSSSQVLMQVMFYVKHLFSAYGKDGLLGDMKLELFVGMKSLSQMFYMFRCLFYMSVEKVDFTDFPKT